MGKGTVWLNCKHGINIVGNSNIHICERQRKQRVFMVQSPVSTG